MSGSSSQYCSRSLPDTSALLPTDTNVAIPRPRFSTWSSTANPSAPDCDDIETRPWRGKVFEKVPFIRTSSLPFSSPMQFGPTIRMPWPRARSIRSACRASPSSPTSEKPAETMQTALTPSSPASSTRSFTAAPGTAMITRSGVSGQSASVGYAATPWTYGAFGLTG